MSDLELLDLNLVLLLSLGEHAVPVLVELLVLLDMSGLDLFLALLVREDHLLVVHLELLLLELRDTVLCHFGLDVSALFLTGDPVLLHCSNEVFDVFLVNLSDLATVLIRIHLLLLHSSFSLN